MSIDKYASPGERRAASRLIRRILEQGHSISVHDGGEWTVRNSTDKAEIAAALCTTDSDTIRVRDMGGNALGSFFLVWGNDPDGSELIADHADSEYCRKLYETGESA